MSTAELAWHSAAQKYSDVVTMGGTPEQRTWAWARAASALDTFVAERALEAKDMARRAKRETIEIETAA